MTLKTRLIACVLLLTSGIALADRPPHGMPAPRMDIDKLEILLDLDAYQKQEVQKILEAQRAAMRAKREEIRAAQTRPSREEMHAQRQAIRKETRAQLEQVLRAEQLAKLDVLTERPQQRHRRQHKAD